MCQKKDTCELEKARKMKFAGMDRTVFYSRKYDPFRNEWQQITEMQCPRNGPAAVVLNHLWGIEQIEK
jgi:hypothetical protein